jgi:glycosyltransferase involved in cell wall biosynthesis
MSTFENVAVILPCFNEEVAIGQVVRELKESLPGAFIYVYDNGSKDKTAEIALAAGAEVRHEPRKGKGNAVRRAFADVDADIYVMLDGDGTYEAAAAPTMVNMLREQHLDLVTGIRIDDGGSQDTYRSGHRLGNIAFTTAVRKVFSSSCEDVLSGYRVMSKRFVKSFPASAKGFEIEVEMTAHASLLRVPTAEYPTIYRDRPPLSTSKLNTYSDGMRIARALFRIFRSYSPSRFFGTLSILSAIVSGVFLLDAGTYSADELKTGHLMSGLFALLGALLLSVGIILNSVSRQRVEALRLSYLRFTS